MAELFFGRTAELTQIEEDLNALADPTEPVQFPINEFLGPRGIGGTAMLGRIAMACAEKNINHLSQGELTASGTSDYIETQLQRGPLVISMELGGLEDERLHAIGTNLDEIYAAEPPFTNKMLVMMTGTAPHTFHKHSLDHRMRLFNLTALSPAEGTEFLEAYAPAVTYEARKAIVEWSGGYPLALRTMADIVKSGLDPTHETDRLPLLRVLTENVIDKTLLSDVRDADDRARCAALLALLSVPRRLNTFIIQGLIERFTPDYQLKNSLQYITVTHYIEQAVPGVISHTLAQEGQGINDALRPLLSLSYRIGQPSIYGEIHASLAEMNDTAAQGAPEHQKAVYLKEAAYHKAQLRSLEQGR